MSVNEMSRNDADRTAQHLTTQESNSGLDKQLSRDVVLNGRLLTR